MPRIEADAVVADKKDVLAILGASADLNLGRKAWAGELERVVKQTGHYLSEHRGIAFYVWHRPDFPLHIAAHEGRSDRLPYLLDQGGEIDGSAIKLDAAHA